MNQLSTIRSLLQNILSTNIPDLPPQKTFNPKHGLPILDDYRKSPNLSFWKSFPSNLSEHANSMVDHASLRSLAKETDFPHLTILESVCKDLSSGAVIGCSGPSRLPSFSTNAPSAFEFGPHVTDALADWIHKGFAYGPIPLAAVPHSAKINGIMTKQKPNGSARVILNLSAPLGNAVNEGIDTTLFPTVMSSTTKWLRALHLAGRGAKMCKIDWADAYKHIAVCIADTNLQWFTWLGMAFKELCLIFGCASSAGIFDRLAKIVVHIVAVKSCFPMRQICQHLDDCCATAPENSNILEVFDATFENVAALIGVKLAPRNDPEKSFAPSQRGLVLGIVYDTVTWTWSLNHEKLSRLLHDIKDFLTTETLPQVRVWSLVGKLIHIRPLIPCGRFNFHHLLKANSHSSDRNALVFLSPDLKRQLWFWYSMIRLCAGNGPLTNPDARLAPWTIDVYSDAAGGSMLQTGLGVGAVSSFWWSYIPWSRAINLGLPTPNGRALSRAMSALELLGPLLVVSAGYVWCKNRPVQVWVDNSASVFIYKKGYSSTCDLSTSLVCAISKVAAGLGCQLEVSKITRCSTPLASMADALSKADFSRFWTLSKTINSNLPLDLAWVPPSLTLWLQNPVATDLLGDQILRDLSKRTLILGVNC